MADLESTPPHIDLVLAIADPIAHCIARSTVVQAKVKEIKEKTRFHTHLVEVVFTLVAPDGSRFKITRGCGSCSTEAEEMKGFLKETQADYSVEEPIRVKLALAVPDEKAFVLCFFEEESFIYDHFKYG